MADYNLKQNLGKIKSNPFNFVLIDGKDSSMVLVTPKPAPGKLVDETKEECGAGKRLAKGIVLKENGMLVFATRGAPQGAWKAMLKKIFQEEKCSAFLPIELRQLGDHESEEVESEDEMTNAPEAPEAPNAPDDESGESEAEEAASDQANPPTPPPREPTPQAPVAQTPPKQQAPPQPSAPKSPQPTPKAPTAPQPTQKAEPVQPPPPLPLAPDAEPLFKKRYQNCLYAELKVPATQAQLKSQLKALMAEAKGLGDQHNFVEGNKKLNEMELLLAKVQPQSVTKNVPTAPSEPKSISLGTYIKGKVTWRETRAAVEADLKALEQAILAASSEEQNFGEISSKVKNLYVMMNTLDATLIDKLDAALKAASPEIKEFADKQSADLVKKYTAFVNSDPLVGAIDNNPFLPVKVKQRLSATLAELGSQIV